MWRINFFKFQIKHGFFNNKERDERYKNKAIIVDQARKVIEIVKFNFKIKVIENAEVDWWWEWREVRLYEEIVVEIAK